MNELNLIKQLVSNFQSTFELKPNLLGTSDEVNSGFYLLDQINFICNYSARSNETLWQTQEVHHEKEVSSPHWN